MDVRKVIKDSLVKVVGNEDIQLGFSDNLEHGDFTTNVAMVLGKRDGLAPKKYADELVAKLKLDENLSNVVDKIEVAGPGFINFWLSQDVLKVGVVNLDELMGELRDVGKGGTVVVDYSGPNIAKAFSIGHLRSTIIGQAI